MSDDENRPATSADLTALEERLNQRIEATENRLIEKMRDMQSELLRGFRVFSDGQVIRLRKLEADHSNLDASLSTRIEAVENRLLEIEIRLVGGSK
jgi:hypothetical protein